MEKEIITVNHIGKYNSIDGQFEYFDNASKKKGQCLLLKSGYKETDINNNDINCCDNNSLIASIEDYGHVVDFEDALIDYTTHNLEKGLNRKITINDIMSLKEDPFKIIEGTDSTLLYPSEIVEKEYRSCIDKLKQYYIRQNSTLCDKENMLKLWMEPKCGMGMMVRSSTGKNILVNNRVGNKAFNIFNSHFLGMECHRDFDVLMTMACFLKYNGIWGGGYAISLKNFDYASVFFGKKSFIDEKIGEPERCVSDVPYTFLIERAVLMVNNISSRTRVTEAVAVARSIDEMEHDGISTTTNTIINSPLEKKRKISAPQTLGVNTPISQHSQYFYKIFNKKDVNNARKRSRAISGNCSHDIRIPLDGILPLSESNEVICLRCFVTIFCFDWDLSITIKDFNSLIKTIRLWLNACVPSVCEKSSSNSSNCHDNYMMKMIDSMSLYMGKVCKRGLNWPLKAMEFGLYEYYTYMLSQILENDRWNHSAFCAYNNGDMEPGLLYKKMNKFGKTLLVLIANCTIHEYDKTITSSMETIKYQLQKNTIPQKISSILNRLPFTKLSGKWFNIQHRGPSVWNFQIYSMKTIGKEHPSLSLESRRLIPITPEEQGDNECCKRIFFKLHCRGSDLSKGGELVSDVCNSVSDMQKMFNNRKYCLSFYERDPYGNSEWIPKKITMDYDADDTTTNIDNCIFYDENRRMQVESSIVIGEPIISLEVTNYRPLKCPIYKNGSLISNRLSTLLDIRSGSKIKVIKTQSKPTVSIVVIENLSDENNSVAACDRLFLGSKILYYDIETTGLNPLAEGVIITSIGCMLSTGNGFKEKSIFAYGKDPQRLKEEILKLYNNNAGDDDDDDDDDNMDSIIDANTGRRIPKIFVVDNELELLVEFNKYVKKCGPLTGIAGWNNNNFDDAFLFATIYKYLFYEKREEEKEEEEEEGGGRRGGERGKGEGQEREEKEEEEEGQQKNKSNSTSNIKLTKHKRECLTYGLYNFYPILNSSSKTVDVSSMICEHFQSNKFNFAKKNSSLERLLSCLMSCPSLDMMKMIGKKFSEILPSMSLNTVLEHICSISNTKAVQKDPIDVKYHLIGYRERTTKENALVQKYCCKDACLVRKPAERMGVLLEIIQLGKESNMSVSVISALYMTQLQIIDGAVLRAMGIERAFMRSCAIRPHSQYIKTLGGHVTTPLAKFQTLHAMDMGSLYPSAMRQNNLDTTTVCIHRQIIECRNRIMTRAPFTWGTPEALKAMDEANAFIMARYRPCDLVVESWKNSRSLVDNHWWTRRAWENCNNDNIDKYDKHEKSSDLWNETNSHNCMNPVTDLGYFPEIGCNADLQLAALVNDDSHVELCSLEYMLPFLVPMIIDNSDIVCEITAGTAATIEEAIVMLEMDFSVEEDEALIRRRLSYKGNLENPEFVMAHSIENKFEEALKVLESNNKVDKELLGLAYRLMSLCARITRRVYMYDSSKDAAVIKWSNRLLNIGTRCRIWNTRQWIRQGTIPLLQRRYREERVELKRQVKIKAKTEPLVAAKLKVEEGVKKLFMNSIYGVLVLRSVRGDNSISRWRTDNSWSRLLVGNAGNGVGGGTKHAPMGNQITQISRRIFLNICPSVRYFFPNCLQGYGDTDSVFLSHNFPGEMNMVLDPLYVPHPVIEMDLVLRERIARLLQIVINCTTKGIKFNPDIAAGEEAMIIEHERLSIVVHTAGKKTYHMIHFREESKLYITLLKSLVSLNMAESEEEERSILKAFETSSVSRIVKLVKNNHYNDGEPYIYPHNANELYRLFSTDTRAAELNKKGGGEIFNHQSLLSIYYNNDNVNIQKNVKLKELSASKYIAAFKLEAICNAFVNGFLEKESSDELIELSTGCKLSDPTKTDDTLVALMLLKVYKKGKFTKKGIAYASKLREIQTACLAWTNQHLFTYDKIVSEHAKRCLSYTENPINHLTVSRVNKEQVPPMGTVVNLPNPTARLINNHLNPSKIITLGEKFLTVLAMSGRVLVDHVSHKIRKETQLFNLPKKRWDPVTERGIVAVSSVKNLGVVCYTMNSIADLINRDCDSIFKIICWCLDSLHNVAKGNGINLINKALSYNTGILISDTFTRFIWRNIKNEDKFVLNPYQKNRMSFNNNDDDDDGDEYDNDYNFDYKKQMQKFPSLGRNKKRRLDGDDGDDDDNSEKKHNRISILRTRAVVVPHHKHHAFSPLYSKLIAIITTLVNNQGKVGVPVFPIKEISDSMTLDEIMDVLSKIFKCNLAVFNDLKGFIKLWTRARQYKTSRRNMSNSKNKNQKKRNDDDDDDYDDDPLGALIQKMPGPKILDVLRTCSNHVNDHASSCRIKLIDADYKIFLKNLVSIMGKENCLETCIRAGAAALLFNLLYCLFLRRERERYTDRISQGDEKFYDIFTDERLSETACLLYKIMKKEEIIPLCFSDRYNPATDSLVYLTEPKQWLGGIERASLHNMKRINLDCISNRINEGSDLIQNSFVGQIIDPKNIHSFSNFEDEYHDYDEEKEYQNLIFRPGFFYKKVIEKMFAALGAMIITLVN